MKMNNYDLVAPVYDVFSRLVFGRSQVKAQIEQLHFIPPATKVLIVGGGTGWVLEEIAKIHVSGLKITYVELSEKMIDLSKRQNFGQNKVTFVHAALEQWPSEGGYDVIITAFLFDNFSNQRADLVFQKLNKALLAKGLWLFCDFKLGAKKPLFWQRFLLKSMYTFFKIIARVEAQHLPEMEPLFLAENYQVMQCKAYYHGFIESIIFQKSGNLHTFI